MSAIAIPSFPGHHDAPLAHDAVHGVVHASSDAEGRPGSQDVFGQARIHAAMSARANLARRNRSGGEPRSTVLRLVRNG